MKTLVCLGDSIVEGEGDELNLGGWVGRLAQKLGPHKGRKFDGFRLFNLGISGDHIVNVFHRLGEVVVRHPDIIILGCAGNDINMYVTDTRQGIPEYRIAKYQAERAWHDTLSLLTKLCPRVLVYGRYNFDDNPGGDRMTRKADSVAHNAFIEAACAQYGAVFMPASGVRGQSEYLSHGSHPNAQGYEAMAAELYAKLTELGWV